MNTAAPDALAAVEVKSEEWDDDAGPSPMPFEGLRDSGPPPFLSKTYDVVDDPDTDAMVSWARGGSSFVVLDPYAFAAVVLPRHFKHCNFSSFVRQLNTYQCRGFRKVDPDRWEFASEGFLKGQKDLLRTIKRRRRRPQPHQPAGPSAAPGGCPCLEVGQFGYEGEIERLKRDKQALFDEVVKLRQEQQSTRAHIASMEERVINAERKQHQMMGFLARALQNPGAFRQLLGQHEMRKELEEAINRKKRRHIEYASHQEAETSELDLGDAVLHLSWNGVTDLGDLGIDMDSLSVEDATGSSSKPEVEGSEAAEGGDDEISKFWNDMLNLGLGDGNGEPSVFHEEDSEFGLSILAHDTDDPPPSSGS